MKEATTTNGITDLREEKKQVVADNLKRMIAVSQELMESVMHFDDTDEAIDNILDLQSVVGALSASVKEWRDAE